MVGRTLSHYKVLDKLGSGGMGDVYVAEDTKLGRKVALKVLPPDMAESESRRKRFEREAKAIAALNHPNIVQVYSVEEAEGVHFITMELVRGKNLSELLPKNGFPLSRFFDIAIPLTDGVAAAHQGGITHRDLKPENAMMSEDGRVKILDFGLAKPFTGLSSMAGSELPTATRSLEGAIVGTLNYMSPEQAEGKAVDPRSDIFSLGVVFYEMLTGRRPFGGETPVAILSSITRDTPTSVSKVRPDLPRDLTRIVRRCLEKNSARRFQSALDLRNDLEEARREVDSGETFEAAAPAPTRLSRGWVVTGGVVALIAVAGIASVVTLRWTDLASPKTPRLVNPAQATSAVGLENFPTWSPDGGRLAYESDQSGNWDVWVVQLGGGEPVNQTSDHKGPDRYPSWSPDGRYIAFLSEREQVWSLYVMSAVGGSPRKVRSLGMSMDVTSPTGAPEWSANGEEIVVPMRQGGRNFVEIVTLRTQDVHRIPLPEHEGNSCFNLSWSPDGSHFAYVDAITSTAEVTRLWVVPATGGEPVPVTDGRTNDWSPLWSPDGRTLFFVSNRGRARDLWQQRMGDNGTPEGEPRPVSAGLEIRSAAFSADGSKFAYSRGGLVSNVWRVPIVRDRPATWADTRQLTFDNAFAEFIDVSPDGKRLLISSDRAGNQDLWVLPGEGGEITRLTTDPTPDWAPRWSPDGKRIVFYSYRSGNRDIWMMPAEGGPADQLTSHPAEDGVPSWSPDGREIAFSSRRTGNRDIWVVGSEGGEPRQMTNGAAGEYYPEYAPNGEWLLFNSSRSGEVRLWRAPVTGGAAEPVGEGPGQMGRFSPDGKTLYISTWSTRRGGDLWALSLKDGREYPVTDLRGRRGTAGHTIATDGEYLYFTWWEDLGDIWIMDVAHQ